MSEKLLNNIVANMGYRNTSEFLLKYVMPLMGVIVFFFLVAMVVLSSLPVYIPFVLLGLGTVFVLAYPYMLYEKRKVNMEEVLHLFITFAGTISTIDIGTNLLFKKIAEKDNLGEIAKSSEKILYFARKWNLGYSKACRIVGSMSPSKIFGDFLDRMAIMIDFGEAIDVFLMDEQEAIMDDYATNYKKSLESIKTVQDIFVAMTMALGFMLAVSLMLPLISGTSIEVVVRYALLAMLGLDVGILFFVKNFIPADKLCYEGPIIDQDTQMLHQWVYAGFPTCAILMGGLFYFNIFPFMMNISIAILPLLFIGLRAQILENAIVSKEKGFPSFIRAFGTAIEVKSGAVDAAIHSLRVHDFGPMNTGLVALYRRLKTGNDKYMSWEYFNSEFGSSLIYQFSQIFSEAIFLGGGPQKVGEIVSHNFTRLLSLRKLRQQLASGFRGALYGALVGFSAAAFVSAKITDLLTGIFSAPLQGQLSAGDNPLGGLISSITPGALAIDMEVISTYIAIMIIVHSIVSAIIIKIVDGGNIYSSLFDICLMIWMGALVAWLIPFGIEVLLPGFSDLSSVAIDTSGVG